MSTFQEAEYFALIVNGGALTKDDRHDTVGWEFLHVDGVCLVVALDTPAIGQGSDDPYFFFVFPLLRLNTQLGYWDRFIDRVIVGAEIQFRPVGAVLDIDRPAEKLVRFFEFDYGSGVGICVMCPHWQRRSVLR